MKGAWSRPPGLPAALRPWLRAGGTGSPLHPVGQGESGLARWERAGTAGGLHRVTVQDTMAKAAPTFDPDEDRQAEADEEDDEHEHEVALGERVQPHGRQPAGRGRG